MPAHFLDNEKCAGAGNEINPSRFRPFLILNLPSREFTFVDTSRQIVIFDTNKIKVVAPKVRELKKHQIFLWIIVFFSIAPQLSGRAQLDSLKEVLLSARGKTRIETLLTLSRLSLYIDAKQSKVTAEEALSLAMQASDNHNTAEAYYYLGFSKYRLCRYQEAINDLYKAVDLQSSLKNYASAAVARNLVAIINYYIGRYEISVKLYSQNLVYYKTLNMMKDYSKMLTNLATVYTKKGDYNKALENLLIAEAYAKKYSPDDDYFVGNIICNAGEAYYGKREYALALQKYLDALAYFKKMDFIDAIASTQMDIGLVYLDTREFPSALNYFTAALNNYQDIQYSKGIMDVKECMIRYYKSLGQYDKAFGETTALEKLCVTVQDSAMLATCYSHYADIYENMRDYSASTKYFRKYFELTARLEEDRNKQSMIGLQILTDAEVKDMENITLKQENDGQKERLKLNTVIFLAMILVLLLVSVFFFLLYKKERNIRAYAALLEKKNEEIKRQNEKLEEAIQAKDKFFSIIAHDLRSPFTGLLGLTELIIDNTDELTHEELIEMVRKLHLSVQNLFMLLKNLLEWTQVQQNTISFKSREIDLQKLVEFNINLSLPLAEKKNIQVTFDLPEQIIVVADEAMLNSVIGNLLSNAIKFTPRGGRITIQYSVIANSTLQLTVSDTGIGIPEDMLDKLFLINEKVGRVGTEGEASTGLGLILSKEFIERNGGTIKVQSTENNGSTFKITLPIKM